MNNELELFKEGQIKYSRLHAIIANILMLLWIIIGTISCWFLYPLAAWIYFTAAFLMVFFLLRKLVCANCFYYDKWCGTGWGKLSALFFKRGNINEFTSCTGSKIAPLTYGLLTLIPIALIIISIVRDFSFIKIVVLSLLLIISTYSGFIGRRNICSKCKMKLICPGSAVK